MLLIRLTNYGDRCTSCSNVEEHVVQSCWVEDFMTKHAIVQSNWKHSSLPLHAIVIKHLRHNCIWDAFKQQMQFLTSQLHVTNTTCTNHSITQNDHQTQKYTQLTGVVMPSLTSPDLVWQTVKYYIMCSNFKGSNFHYHDSCVECKW